MDRLMVGVSGVRGTVGHTLTAQVAYDFGCAFATYLGAGKTVVLGRDSRPSGAMLKNAVASGLQSGGIHVVQLGLVSTPGVALMTKHLRADGGVIITASHNPGQYNGIKFLQPGGKGLTAGMAGRLKEIWQGGEFTPADPQAMGTETVNNLTHATHLDAIKALVDATGIASRRFKVALDSINGAGCVGTPMLLGELGCEVVHLNSEPTGRFAHEPEPLEKNLTGLCEAVRKHKTAVGFAQDPDADRLALVDETGRYIGEEYTFALAAAYVLRHRKGPVATNLATSRMIDDIASQTGCEVFRSPTGEANVVEAMESHNCVLGGEGGGGVIDPRIVPVRNSFVGIALTLQYILETGKTLSELVADIPAYVMIKTKQPCQPDSAREVARLAREHFSRRDDATFNDQDGLRVDLPEGWVCVRASNTEPIMRIMAEARDRETAEGLVRQVRDLAEEIRGD